MKFKLNIEKLSDDNLKLLKDHIAKRNMISDCYKGYYILQNNEYDYEVNYSEDCGYFRISKDVFNTIDLAKEWIDKNLFDLNVK